MGLLSPFFLLLRRCLRVSAVGIEGRREGGKKRKRERSKSGSASLPWPWREGEREPERKEAVLWLDLLWGWLGIEEGKESEICLFFSLCSSETTSFSCGFPPLSLIMPR